MIPIFWQESRVPDILVSENGRSIAVGKGNDGLLLLYPKRNKFVSDIWTAACGEVAKDNTNKFYSASLGGVFGLPQIRSLQVASDVFGILTY